MKNVPLKPLVPSVRRLLAPVPRLAPADTDSQTDRQTDTRDNCSNPLAHARRGLISSTGSETDHVILQRPVNVSPNELVGVLVVPEESRWQKVCEL